MNSVTVIALGALLGAILLTIVALMLWQESRRRGSADPTEFLIEDAADHVVGLGVTDLKRPAVLAIVEWHMLWVTEQIRDGASPVIGPTPDAVQYIRSQGLDVSPPEVETVLEGVTDYVASIGAVGPAF